MCEYIISHGDNRFLCGLTIDNTCWSTKARAKRFSSQESAKEFIALFNWTWAKAVPAEQMYVFKYTDLDPNFYLYWDGRILSPQYKPRGTRFSKEDGEALIRILDLKGLVLVPADE